MGISADHEALNLHTCICMYVCMYHIYINEHVCIGIGDDRQALNLKTHVCMCKIHFSQNYRHTHTHTFVHRTIKMTYDGEALRSR
jgi:hypothetical protein